MKKTKRGRKTKPHYTKIDKVIDIIVIFAIILGLACISTKTFFDFRIGCISNLTLLFITGVVCPDFLRTFLRKGPLNLIKYHSLDLIILITSMILFTGILYPATGRVYHILTKSHLQKKRKTRKNN